MGSCTLAIVTPSFNHGLFIEETIRSVILQSGDFYIDYVVVDGGSTDNTLEILRKYELLVREKKIPIFCRGISFRWICESDNGMYDAINKGFGFADGEIMSWINSDDQYTPWAFRTICRLFSEFSDVEWLTGMHSYITPDGIMYKSLVQVVYSQHLMRCGCYEGRTLFFVQQEGTFWKRVLWERAGERVNSTLKLAGDYELWMRFAHYAPLVTINAALAGFRVLKKQASEDKDRYYKEIDSLLPACNKKLLQQLKWHNYFKSNGLLNRILKSIYMKTVPDIDEMFKGSCIYYDDVAHIWIKEERYI